MVAEEKEKYGEKPPPLSVACLSSLQKKVLSACLDKLTPLGSAAKLLPAISTAGAKHIGHAVLLRGDTKLPMNSEVSGFTEQKNCRAIIHWEGKKGEASQHYCKGSVEHLGQKHYE